MEGTFWAFMPAIIAIVLALVTKQVYVSLFLGIFVGAMMYAGGEPLNALHTMYQVMSDQIGSNAPILVFLVVLGILVILIQKSGGSKAYGDWAGRKIKTKGGALGATAGLGCLIFVDDYFNCLTVGSVMRPVTDKFKISRSKLAYIIDATAAPICIIAPISSWAAAVSGYLDGDGLVMFMSTIPFNVYALLTIVMVFALCFIKFDFGKMKRNDMIAEKTGDVHAGIAVDAKEEAVIPSNTKGRVFDLLIPVVILIACCIGGMLYTGFFYNWGSELSLDVLSTDFMGALVNADGSTIITLQNNANVLAILGDAGIPLVSSFSGLDYGYLVNGSVIELFISTPTLITEGETFAIYSVLQVAGITPVMQSANVIEAFSNCDAGMSLAIGSTVALIIIALYYMIRKVVSFKEVTESFTEGFKAMVPAILILTFAWSISGIIGARGGYLNLRAFVENNLSLSASYAFLFPAIFFILAGVIAFSTGTSWGTFGVLVPIAVAILGGSGSMAILTVSATLGGAVFGDHISPISDTTILASAGAQCNHVEHVNTQLPYAAIVAGLSVVAYLVAGLCVGLGSVLACIIMWAVTLALFVGVVFVIKFFNKRKGEQPDQDATEEISQ